MTPEEVRRLYGAQYAATYNERFLHAPLAKDDTAFEVVLLERLLAGGGPWLDVACGTGYFLGRFPAIDRAGLDVSPAMLALARQENPGVPFHCRSFLDEIPEWEHQWKLVSCMWYAYGLVSSVAEVGRVVANLARWTAPGGVCFLPLADPELVAQTKLPYHVAESPWNGRVMVTGITWSYEEGPGELHAHMVAPQVPYMVELFEQYFASIEMPVYPLGRRAIVARGKRGV